MTGGMGIFFIGISMLFSGSMVSGDQLRKSMRLLKRDIDRLCAIL
ncbi:hypothetical protein [Peribacillus loiseleuriae]